MINSVLIQQDFYSDKNKVPKVIWNYRYFDSQISVTLQLD
jgi:hypothetical protein